MRTYQPTFPFSFISFQNYPQNVLLLFYLFFIFLSTYLPYPLSSLPVPACLSHLQPHDASYEIVNMSAGGEDFLYTLSHTIVHYYPEQLSAFTCQFLLFTFPLDFS